MSRKIILQAAWGLACRGCECEIEASNRTASGNIKNCVGNYKVPCL